MAIPEHQPPSIPPATASGEADRGRQADSPTEMPSRGWLDIFSRTGARISSDSISIVAAGVAFYGFVALVPALAATIGIYGLVSDPAQVGEQVTAFARLLPREVLPILEQQLKRISSDTSAAGLSAALGLLLALWSSASATKALTQGLNISYAEDEKRGFLKLNAIALILTLGIILGAVVAIALVAVLPALLAHLSFGSALDPILAWARWPVLLGGFVVGLAVLYRYAPSREYAKWRWISPGALTAAILWVTGSALFSLYVAKFGSYDKTYGSLGAIVVFLLWMFLSAFVVLLGAELNSEIERQTVKDTTDGAPQPLGQRGAFAADSVGPSRSDSPASKKGPPDRIRHNSDASAET